MTAIRAVHVASRQRASSQNGLPESVPYVYGQQTRRNTYAARIARRNVEGWWQPPAALPEPKVTRPQAPTGTAAQVNLVRSPSGWAEILTVAHAELHVADLERRRSGRGAGNASSEQPALTATWTTRSAPEQSHASAHVRWSPGT